MTLTVAEGYVERSCPVCQGTQFRIFSTLSRHRIVICRSCGLFYVNPIPSESLLEKTIAGADFYTQDQLRKQTFFRRRAVQLLTHVEQILPPGNLLDIGCSIGTELIVARERGWNGSGIELSDASIKIARDQGLSVLASTLEKSDLPEGYFDLVTANHVVEHIAYPDQFFGALKRVLRSTGYLFVAVPNVNHWQRFVQQQKYVWTFQDDHFAHFSVDTLRRFLQLHGFEIVELYTNRCYDFFGDLASQSLQFRMVNSLVERAGLGIEIFCLARPAAG